MPASSPQRLACALALCLAAAAPLRAEEEPEHPPDPTTLELEFGGVLTTPLVTKFKLGPEPIAQSLEPYRDAHWVRRAELSYMGTFHLALAKHVALSASAWLYDRGESRRHVHHQGVTLNGRGYPGNTRLGTRITLHYVEVTGRFVWVNRKQVQIWLGAGPAYHSYRVALRGPDHRATARAEIGLAAFAYGVNYQATEWARLFLVSTLGLGLGRLPSYVSDFRAGCMFRLAGGLHLSLAFVLRSGLLADFREEFRREVRRAHTWKRVRWNTGGLQVGLVLRI